MLVARTEITNMFLEILRSLYFVIKPDLKLYPFVTKHQVLKIYGEQKFSSIILKHLTPNGHYMGRTAQLTSRCCILYIYSANLRTEYFKHAA